MNKLNEFLGQFGAECLETLAIVSYDWLRDRTNRISHDRLGWIKGRSAE